MADIEPRLTTAEVADIANLDTETIRRMIRTGRLPAVKFGNTYRIDPADARALVTPPAPKQAKPRNRRENIARLMRAS